MLRNPIPCCCYCCSCHKDDGNTHRQLYAAGYTAVAVEIRQGACAVWFMCLYAQTARVNSYILLLDGQTMSSVALMPRRRAHYWRQGSEARSSTSTQRGNKRGWGMCSYHALHPISVCPYSLGGGPRGRAHGAGFVCGGYSRVMRELPCHHGSGGMGAPWGWGGGLKGTATLGHDVYP